MAIIKPFGGKTPEIDPDARVAETAVLVGDVRLAAGASVWYGAVLRGDSGTITLGEGSNIQDNCTLHGDVAIGCGVTVGHGATLHGCTVHDTCLIGMGAVLLDGVQVGAGSMVGAGALVTKNTTLPPGSLVLGSPAKAARAITPKEAANIPLGAQRYVQLAREQLPE